LLCFERSPATVTSSQLHILIWRPRSAFTPPSQNEGFVERQRSPYTIGDDTVVFLRPPSQQFGALTDDLGTEAVLGVELVRFRAKGPSMTMLLFFALLLGSPRRRPPRPRESGEGPIILQFCNKTLVVCCLSTVRPKSLLQRLLLQMCASIHRELPQHLKEKKALGGC